MRWNNPEQYIIYQQTVIRLYVLIDKLPGLYKIVFIDYFLKNKSITRIAKKYKKSNTYINLLKHRTFNFVSKFMNNDRNLNDLTVNHKYYYESKFPWYLFDPPYLKNKMKGKKYEMEQTLRISKVYAILN